MDCNKTFVKEQLFNQQTGDANIFVDRYLDNINNQTNILNYCIII